MFDSQLLLEISVVGIVLYTLVLVVYRLYLSPVAHIPGPKLAALTHLYEGYYDVFGHQGRFLWKCKELHDRYGPIVRIGPEEVHIQDADFYSEIYANAARKRDKYPFYIWPVRTVSDKYGNHAAFFTVDHDLHRRRRNILNHFFSKKNIHDLEGRVCGKIRRLEMRLRESIGTGRPVDLLSAFSALTMDVICEYSFGQSIGMLERPDFSEEYLTALVERFRLQPVGRQFPWLMVALLKVPTWLMARLSPAFVKYQDYNDAFLRLIKQATGKRGTEAPRTYTVMSEILESDVPESEKSPARVTAEALILIGAGTETTARTLSVITFHLLSNRTVTEKLRAELISVMPTPDSVPSLASLEKLPYLAAIISEGLRLASPVPGRSPRVARDEDLFYKGYKIPAGTAMSESIYLVHTNADIFPEPREFIPERWLEADAPTKYLVPFSKGARHCLGMNLAIAELYLTVVRIFRTLDLELFETTTRDVEIFHEYIVGRGPADSKGIRAKVVGAVLR